MVSSTPWPHFKHGKESVPILQEARWAPGPVWTGEKFRPHRDSIPDRPARSQSLYRLSYPVHFFNKDCSVFNLRFLPVLRIRISLQAKSIKILWEESLYQQCICTRWTWTHATPAQKDTKLNVRINCIFTHQRFLSVVIACVCHGRNPADFSVTHKIRWNTSYQDIKAFGFHLLRSVMNSRPLCTFVIRYSLTQWAIKVIGTHASDGCQMPGGWLQNECMALSPSIFHLTFVKFTREPNDANWNSSSKTWAG